MSAATAGTRVNSARILVVDDDSTNRMVLKGALVAQGYDVVLAEDGLRAVKIMRTDKAIDLLLLDLIMPEMDGLEVLRFMKGEVGLGHIPVVMISSIDDAERIAVCLELGADDYLSKPFDPLILKARVSSSLTRKRWHDVERSYMGRIEKEEAKSERLLASLLPRHVAERLKAGEQLIADEIEQASVLFLDIVGFSAWARNRSPDDVVQMLNSIFSDLDQLVAKFGIEKIKTVGDGYLAVSGLPGSESTDPALAIARFALACTELIANSGLGLDTRIGLHTGPLVAGVIGSDKPVYDVWGDTVNIASRLESHGESGRIQISSETHDLIKDSFVCTERGVVELKNRGPMTTFWLENEK